MYSLKGKKALVTGIANDSSIAYGCAKALRERGADLAITYLNEKADPHVRPLAEELGAEIYMPLNVQDDASGDALADEITKKWGKLDILLHSIAFCPKEDLHARVIDTSSAGFQTAMDISVHSFLRMIRRCEPLMPNGGCCLTLSYQGSARVVDHYNIMGPVKAALEASVRYAAFELGPKNIRVSAISPGPIMTRAASGIGGFEHMLEEAAAKSATHQLVTIEEVGAYAAFLASDEAKSLTGNVHIIDGGASIMG